jgi:hypothetical protein
MGVHNCNPSYSGEGGRRIVIKSWPHAKQHKIRSVKQIKAKRARGVAQVVE